MNEPYNTALVVIPADQQHIDPIAVGWGRLCGLDKNALLQILGHCLIVYFSEHKPTDQETLDDMIFNTVGYMIDDRRDNGQLGIDFTYEPDYKVRLCDYLQQFLSRCVQYVPPDTLSVRSYDVSATDERIYLVIQRASS